MVITVFTNWQGKMSWHNRLKLKNPSARTAWLRSLTVVPWNWNSARWSFVETWRIRRPLPFSVSWWPLNRPCKSWPIDWFRLDNGPILCHLNFLLNLGRVRERETIFYKKIKNLSFLFTNSVSCLQSFDRFVCLFCCLLNYASVKLVRWNRSIK